MKNLKKNETGLEQEESQQDSVNVFDGLMHKTGRCVCVTSTGVPLEGADTQARCLAITDALNDTQPIDWAKFFPCRYL